MQRHNCLTEMRENMGILSDLEPVPVFKYFEEICSIPHGSGNTKTISNFLVSFARGHGLEFIQDSFNNVIIWKDGTKGYENSPSVIIQGHMDMVCEKEAMCNIDFEKDGLELQLADGTISASGTTLGGDDGIAVAYALAILSSSDIPHPPIEAVFTVDEETGMTGAAGLDYSLLKSHTMLNIDSEEEGYLLVSCAGGATVTAHLPVKRENIQGRPFTININGLRGGHSGTGIDKGRANANLLMGRTLYALSKKYSFNIITINGGKKDNAIPREASAEIIFAEETDTRAASLYLNELNSIYLKEYQSADAGINLDFIEGGSQAGIYNALSSKATSKAIMALINLPNGIQRMSHDIEGLVQTSLNLGILKTCGGEIQYNYSVRSSISSEKEELIDRIECLIKDAGGYISRHGDYPAWEYKKDSPLRQLMAEVFEEQYGRKPVIQAIHAGVECGLFAEGIKGLDCVSYGPDIKNIHTPQECMDIKSVQRTWRYTLAVLKRLQ